MRRLQPRARRTCHAWWRACISTTPLRCLPTEPRTVHRTPAAPSARRHHTLLADTRQQWHRPSASHLHHACRSWPHAASQAAPMHWLTPTACLWPTGAAGHAQPSEPCTVGCLHPVHPEAGRVQAQGQGAVLAVPATSVAHPGQLAAGSYGVQAAAVLHSATSCAAEAGQLVLMCSSSSSSSSSLPLYLCTSSSTCLTHVP